MPSEAPTPSPRLQLPDAATLTAGQRQACWLTADGEIELLDLAAAAARAQDAAPMICHARALVRRLGCAPFAAYDVLELFAFVRPARFCLPTPRGLAEALGIPLPRTLEDEAAALRGAAVGLLAELQARTDQAGADEAASSIAASLAGADWPWGRVVLAALGAPAEADLQAGAGPGLAVWRKLPEWSAQAPPPPPGTEPVASSEARARLTELLEFDAEARPQQADYASAVSGAFVPRPHPSAPAMVLAQAGTGTGKTLGYIAPASVWAEKNKGTVWLSTYTRNLQRQLDDELDRLYPDPELKAAKVVIRKGRENYLCLLNYEDAVSRFSALRYRDAVGVGLLARWAAHTRDGDFGGDFPAWLIELVGPAATTSLADRRGECVYSACQHYDKCFIERSVRRARHAAIVVANHALVMTQAALGGVDDTALPTHYVFDEGHHVFDAADQAFSGHLTGLEAADLRRWILGREDSRRRRSRGLSERAADVIGDDARGHEAFQAVLAAAHALPGPGWPGRVTDARPNGPAEAFLAFVRRQVYMRVAATGSLYDLETDIRPPIDDLAAAGDRLQRALSALAQPMALLRQRLAARLDNEAEALDSPTRSRIEAICRGLQRRGEVQLSGWQAMLATLNEAPPSDFVDWFGVQRIDGRDFDVGMHRHWLDPTAPFADTVAARAHGVVITSATLTDGTGDDTADWTSAETRTGAAHLDHPAIRARVASPFDYPAQTRVLCVGDVRKDDLDQVAAAYRELFKAAGGGALGLFTAIVRLKAVQARIAEPLEAAGLPLYAQHVDGMNVATLIDIFRAETDACLLGTDAVRDGVDVPGRSLRLIVFDRVPWPRPSILHRARKEAFGGARYVDMLTRLRLAQAYGRLIRRATDRGVFVLLDPMMPSRLAGAFPTGVEIARRPSRRHRRGGRFPHRG